MARGERRNRSVAGHDKACLCSYVVATFAPPLEARMCDQQVPSQPRTLLHRRLPITRTHIQTEHNAPGQTLPAAGAAAAPLPCSQTIIQRLMCELLAKHCRATPLRAGACKLIQRATGLYPAARKHKGRLHKHVLICTGHGKLRQYAHGSSQMVA